MKIAIVGGDDVLTEYGPATESGIGETCEQLAARLVDHGHSVTAYSRRRDRRGAAVIKGRYRSVGLRVGPTAVVPPREVLPFIGQWSAKLDSAWSSDPPDIVHAFGWLGGMAAQLAARKRHLPTVQSFYGLASTDPAGEATERARLEPLLIRNAGHVTGGSSDEMDVLARLRRSRARVSLLSTGVDIESFSAVEPKPAGNRLHRILQIEPNTMPANGFDRTIQVLPWLPGTELVLAETAAASGEYEAECAAVERMAVATGVEDRVHFVGNVGPKELSSLIESADVVACTARQVPRATTALSAMASGVAVVGVAVGALADTLVGGVTGMLVSPHDTRELTAALKMLTSQNFQRDSMGSAGRSRALSRFSWDRIALDALNIYQQASPPCLPQRRATAPKMRFSAVN